MSITELTTARSREIFKKKYAQFLKGTRIANLEADLVRKDGTVFPVLVVSTPIIKDGCPAGVRGIVINISHGIIRDEEKPCPES